MLKVLRDGLKDCVMRIRRFFIKKNVIGVLIESNSEAGTNNSTIFSFKLILRYSFYLQS